MHFDRAGRTQREFDLTPLIDVVFNLLLFFILTASFVKLEAMEVGLPDDAKEKSKPVASSSMLIDISSDGRVWVDRREVHYAEVREKLREGVNGNKDIAINVRAGNLVSVQKLVTLLDMVYQSGSGKVAIEKWDESDKPESKPDAPLVIEDGAPAETLEDRGAE